MQVLNFEKKIFFSRIFTFGTNELKFNLLLCNAGRMFMMFLRRIEGVTLFNKVGSSEI